MALTDDRQRSPLALISFALTRFTVQKYAVGIEEHIAIFWTINDPPGLQGLIARSNSWKTRRYRDPDLAATAVGEVMDSGMRAYIPYSLITFSPSKPWFDHACSSAISDREGAHRSYQASPSELIHATFISARNCCSAKLHRAHSSFRKRKIDKLNSSPTEKCFWSLSKKSSTTSVTPAFPLLFALMAL